MSWMQTGVSSQSLSKKTAAIGAILLKSAVYQVGGSLLLASVFVIGAVASFLLLALSGDLSQKYFGQSDTAISMVVFPLLAAEICVWLLLGWQVAKWRTRTETIRWQTQRSLKLAHPEYHRWLQRARRWSLLVPSAIALPILLFFPETCAITSHIFNPHAGQMDQYRMRIPITWIVIHEQSDPATGFSLIYTWKAKGYARNWGHETLFSEVSLMSRVPGTNDVASQPPIYAKIISTRTLVSGDTAMTCWEYIPHYMDWGMWRTFVDCSSTKGDFYAAFAGEKDYLPTFYNMLENARQTQ